MDVNHLTAEELAGYVYLKGPATPVEAALLKHLQAVLDEAEELRDMVQSCGVK